VHNAALKRLTELPRKKREKMLKALIVSGTKDIAKGRIYANKEDADFVKTVTNLKFSEGIECTSGILIEKEDKTIRLDYRTEIILNEIWKNSLEEISRILFM
jgi:V/A-type H+-transporting ATPase subunit E